ncbi:MAG: copper ion binding protein, partial [candidate division Zixibacteria bacterium]
MKATDPVCKMTVDTETAKFKTEYDGESYFFCAEGCKNKFERSPLTYLNESKETIAEPSHSKKGGGIEISLPVTGMSCASCVGKVEKAIGELDGVIESTVNLATEKATIKYDPAMIDTNKIIDRIKSSGYDVPLQTTKLAISGMSCASCVAAIEKSLGGIEGVTSASVNLATERAAISHFGGVSLGELKSAIENAGYAVIDADIEEAGDIEREIREREYIKLK